jgi:chromosome partitioning protein
MRRISILNFKGGTGKTSLATNLAYALALQKKRILLIDCDLQSNASSLLPERRDPTLTHVLKGEALLSEAIQPAREYLDLIPSDQDLHTAANYITAMGMRAYATLKSATRNMTTYDFLFFDHSPSYSPITEAALLASDEMLIPCELAPYAIQGLVDMITKLGDTLSGLDHEVTMTGIVPFKLDQRYSMTEQYLTSLKKRFGERIIHPVRTDATISRAQSLGQTVFEYNPRSKVAGDFLVLADYLLAQGQEVSV